MEENFDSIIFSCDWDNYQNNILVDKENKTVGEWGLDREKLKSVKYAYAYLTNSKQTVVKKFHIDKWEDAQIEKGYRFDWKSCFTFTYSEDVFFEWNRDPVQAPRYVNSNEMDLLPPMREERIKMKLHKSEITPKVKYESVDGAEGTQRIRVRGKGGTRKKLKAETPREKLAKVYRDKFTDKFKFNVKTDLLAISSLEQQVQDGSEPEAVLTEYFNSLQK